MRKINSIYIIDDDPITVFGIQKILQLTLDSPEIHTFSNGKLAIEGIMSLLQNHEEIPEVLFLDINMPIMDGWQFLEEFIKLPIDKKVRVNILTSSIDPLDKQNWRKYETMTHHTLTFNNKPLRKEHILEITAAA